MVFCFDGNSSFAVFENLNRMGYLSELLLSPPAGGIWGSGTPESSKNVHFCDACHLNHNFFRVFTVVRWQSALDEAPLGDVCVQCVISGLNRHLSVYSDTDSSIILRISYLQ